MTTVFCIIQSNSKYLKHTQGKSIHGTPLTPYTMQLDSIMSFAALFGLLSPLFGLVTDRWGSRAACFIGNWNPYRNPNPNP